MDYNIDKRVVIDMSQSKSKVNENHIQRAVVLGYSFCRNRPGTGIPKNNLEKPCVESLFLNPKRTFVLISEGPPVLPLKVTFFISDI